MKQRGSLWSQILRMCKSVFGRTWTNLVRAISRYGQVNGGQCAASFAYYAFFSLLPLILLVRTTSLELIRWNQDLLSGIFTSLLPTLILFYCLLMFYRFAPRGRSATFKQVWPAALFAAIALKFCQHLFGFYLTQFITFNPVYGAFGTIIA